MKDDAPLNLCLYHRHGRRRQTEKNDLRWRYRRGCGRKSTSGIIFNVWWVRLVTVFLLAITDCRFVVQGDIIDVQLPTNATGRPHENRTSTA